MHIHSFIIIFMQIVSHTYAIVFNPIYVYTVLNDILKLVLEPGKWGSALQGRFFLTLAWVFSFSFPIGFELSIFLVILSGC